MPFSGTGTKGSQVAIATGGQELGRTPVDDSGTWDLVVELDSDVDEVELQALDSEDNIAATSDPIPFTVVDSDEQANETAVEMFTADPLPETSGGALITVSGAGQPGYRVAIGLNGEQAAETEIDEAGLWSAEVNSGDEAAEVSADLISPEGEVLETITVGQIEAVETMPPEIDVPGDDVMAGAITLSGSGQPGTTLLISADGQEVGTAVVGDDGAWSLDAELPEGEHQIEVVMLDADGNATETATTVTLTVAAPEAPGFIASRLPLPAFSALTGALAWIGDSEPGSSVAILVDGEPVEIVTTDSDGQWQININLAPGAQDIAFGRVDEDGNVLSQSETVQVDLPEQLPQISLPDFSLPGALLASLGEEASADDGADRDRLLAGLTLDGTALPALLFPAGLTTWDGSAEPGSEVAVIVDGEVVDTTTVGADGSFTLFTDLTEGAHTIQLGMVDEDGELSGQSREITISAADGDLPSIEISATDDALTVSGTAVPGSTVEITAGGEVIGEVTAGEDGSWSYEIDPLPDGTSLRARIVGEDGVPLLQSIPLFVSGLVAGTGAEEASISGEITTSEDVTLPDDAVITVQIQDTSRQDVPAVVIGEQIIETNGQQLPIPYEVTYDPAEIDERFTYSMRVQIEDGDGNLLFTNDTAIPVITNGNPTENVEIPAVPVADSGTDGAEQGQASVTGSVAYKERIALPDDAVVTVQIQDILTPGAAANVIGEQVIETNGQQVPIPYDVAYNPADIVDNHTYSIAARIEDGSGNLLFINDTVNPVITNGNPTEDVLIETVKVNTAVSDVVLDESADVLGEEGESAVEAVEESGSFSKFLEGLQAAGLSETLADVEGEYTLFAPTDEAFQSIPPELVEAWDANPEAYEDILRHSIVEGKYALDELTDGQVLTSLSGKDIVITRDGDVVYANDVPIVDSAEVGNSVVYAVPQVILPVFADGDTLPIIDESGVPTFVGPLLTVVGLGEPGTEILLTIDEEQFGEIATVEPNGFWLVKENIDSGVHYILAYMLDEQGLIKGISQEVILPVP